MGSIETTTIATGDNLDRLLGLLEAARAEDARRPRVDLATAYRHLLEALDGTEPGDLAA